MEGKNVVRATTTARRAQACVHHLVDVGTLVTVVTSLCLHLKSVAIVGVGLNLSFELNLE